MAIKFLGRKIVLQSGRVAIIPDTALDGEAMDKMPKDRVCKIEVVVPRNPKFHRKGFALISVIFGCMSQEVCDEFGIYSSEMLRKRMLLELGRFTMMVVGKGSKFPEGTIMYEIDSMSFDSMDDSEFETVYNQFINLAIDKYITGQNEESINAMVDEVLRFGS